jgi:hypothetical protein
MKRTLVLADSHCGHQCGLTPPEWQSHRVKQPIDRAKRAKFATAQQEAWDWYVERTALYKPFDLVILNGDAIDGRGERSGSTELLTVDRHEQCEMACQCLRQVMTAKSQLVMTYGTGYHVGQEEDFEGVIASDMGAVKIGGHEWVDSEGVILDCKHKCGSSTVPHSRHTAVAREALWSRLWAERGLTPRADIIIRSHVHYYQYCGTEDFVAFTTPALQTMGSKYGARQCSGLVDFGFIVIETDKGEFTWTAEIASLKSEAAKAVKV